MNNELKSTAQEITNLMDGFTNANVVGNKANHLQLWSMVFMRVLEPDGKRLLFSHNQMRFNVKKRAKEAIDHYPGHAVCEPAALVMDFLEQVEYWGLTPADWERGGGEQL
jgi:hypothetical protein